MVSMACRQPMIPGKTPKNASFGAGWCQFRRWWFWVQAAVARSAKAWRKDGDLAFKAIDRAVHIWQAQFDAAVINQVTRWEIIGAINDDVVLAENFFDVG